ncbi:MAG: alpha-amylase [Anaerolineae bacterium]|nr:alpha-amylase [Anaerolineae bacterium]
MEEFVFGSLATLPQRVERLQNQQKGVWHQNRLRPHPPRATDHPILTVTTQLPVRLNRVTCYVTTPESFSFDLTSVATGWDLLNWSYSQTWEGELPAYPDGTVVRYTITAYPVNGDPIPADNGDPFAYRVSDPTPPAWAQTAIIYQIFPDRFSPGRGRDWPPVTSLNDIYGGTLRGIIEQLDYLADLGCNTLWLNPFFPDDTHHGYHATDYFTVNPRLGTLADIQELIQASHKRGIRLILDFVANHWGRQHPTFQAAQADPHSIYHDWYTWKQWPDEYETFFGVQDLPQINTRHPQARAHLLESVRYWLQMGFDGLRLDYALGPPLEFWTDLRAAASQVKPDVWLFGEVVEPPDVQLEYCGRFHGCLDFLLAQMLRSVFALHTRTLVQLEAFLTTHEAYFPPYFSRPSFLDNHDMDRFLFLAGGDIRNLKLAALCQFTLPAPPILYYGTELGLSQTHPIHTPHSEGMAECRQPMPWNTLIDNELLAYYHWLIHLRLAHPALWQQKRHTLHLTEDTWVYALASPNETALVILNLSQHEQTVEVTLPQTTLPTPLTLPPCTGDLIFIPHNS